MNGAAAQCVDLACVRQQGQSFASSGRETRRYNSFSVSILEQLQKWAVHQKALFYVAGSKQENIGMLQGKLIEFAASFVDQGMEL